MDTFGRQAQWRRRLSYRRGNAAGVRSIIAKTVFDASRHHAWVKNQQRSGRLLFRKTLERDWAKIIAGDSSASPCPRKLYNDLAEKRQTFQVGVRSQLRHAQIQGIGMVYQQPRLFVMTKWDKRVAIVNNRADEAGVARPDLDRVATVCNRGAPGAFNRGAKSARK